MIEYCFLFLNCIFWMNIIYAVITYKICTSRFSDLAIVWAIETNNFEKRF